MDQTILVLNIGSSSVKYAVFNKGNLDVISQGKIDCLPENSEQTLRDLIEKMSSPDLVVHRIVHGGAIYSKPVLLTDQALQELSAFSVFAPLHQPHNINGVKTIQNLLPNIPQYGCFDTAFHTGHDELHSVLPIPQILRDNGMRRFGFHGISYKWISRQMKSSRVVVAHLGSGASLCALLNGKSIDTTMGMTALDGLPMATRTGAIDPGFVLYLAQDLKYTPQQIERLLYNECGLKGLSGLSGDIRTLLKSDSPMAKLAIDYFVFKTAQYIAMMAVSLQGLDNLVFTGGIGENSETIRDEIVRYLNFLPPFDISVIPTNEEKMMAIEVVEEFGNA